MSERTVELEPVVLYGHTIHLLTTYGDEEEIDTIVIGRKGISPRVEHLDRSVAKGGEELVTLPVTVV